MAETLIRAAISLIVPHPNAPQTVLLQKRNKLNSAYFGLWELPQGKIRADETLTAAAKRELREETGLQLLSLASRHAVTTRDNGAEILQPLCCITDPECHCLALAVVVNSQGTPKDTAEAIDHRWFDRQQIMELRRQRQLFPLNEPMLEAYFQRP